MVTKKNQPINQFYIIIHRPSCPIAVNPSLSVRVERTLFYPRISLNVLLFRHEST